MLVKNEIDIIGYVLKEAERWCDKIFILDNGSTDGTWELIQSMKNDIITPWKQYFGEYHDGLRAEVYNEFKDTSTPGDWWCYKLDADEVYAEDPREFLSNTSKKYHWVGKRDINYRITKEDLEEYNFTGKFEEDKKYLKYFPVPCWSEGRFFRFRKNLSWEPEFGSHYPKHIGVMSPEYITVYHYSQRSPQQIQKRAELRKDTLVYKKGLEFAHENKDIKSRSFYEFDDGDIEKLKTYPVTSGNFKQNFFKNLIKRFLICLNLYN